MITYVIAIGSIFAVVLALICVERFYRWFAARHPECGPYREKSFGCAKCKKKGQRCEEYGAQASSENIVVRR